MLPESCGSIFFDEDIYSAGLTERIKQTRKEERRLHVGIVQLKEKHKEKREILQSRILFWHNSGRKDLKRSEKK